MQLVTIFTSASVYGGGTYENKSCSTPPHVWAYVIFESWKICNPRYGGNLVVFHQYNTTNAVLYVSVQDADIWSVKKTAIQGVRMNF